MYRLKADREFIYDQRLQNLMPYLAAVIAAWCAGFLSLSRCYPTPTYTIIGLMAAFVNLAGIYIYPRRSVLYLDKPLVHKWILCSALVLMAMFTATKMFARFG